MKPKFQVIETRVSSNGNYSFKRLKLLKQLLLTLLDRPIPFI